MARDSKLEVAAINIRIPSNKNRDYSALLSDIQKLKTPVKVYGDSYVMMTSYWPDESFGVFSKFTQIEIDSRWFNVDTFDATTPSDVAKINIPNNLRPNFSQFFFTLSESLHVVAFERYSDSKSLSLNAVELFFHKVVDHPSIIEKYGRVEATIINDHPNAARLLSLPDLREVRMVIRRPNSDDVGDDLARVIEERLARQNGDEYEEVIRSKSGAALEPDARTKKLGMVAVENGELAVKSVVNGVTVPQAAKKTPMIEVEKYKSDELPRPIYNRLVGKIFAKVEAARRKLRAQN